MDGSLHPPRHWLRSYPSITTIRWLASALVDDHEGASWWSAPGRGPDKTVPPRTREEMQHRVLHHSAQGGSRTECGGRLEILGCKLRAPHRGPSPEDSHLFSQHSAERPRGHH